MLIARSWMLFSRILVLVFLLSAFAPTARAEKWKMVTKITKLKVGDKLQYKHHGDWLDATVIKIQRFGSHRQIKVRYYSPIFKKQMTWPAQEKDLRISATRSRRSGSSKKGNPFDLKKGNPFEVEKGLRTWRNNTGEFTIEAELVEIKGNSVVLKRRDENEVTVPLDRLCKEDRDYIKRLNGEADGTNESEHNTDVRVGDDEYIDYSDLTTRRADSSGAAMVYLSADDESSSLEADGGTASGKEAAKLLMRRPVALPPRSGIFSRAQGIRVAADAPNQVMLPLGSSTAHDLPTKILLLDIKKGSRKTRTMRFPASAIGLDISPSGEQVLSMPNGFHLGTKTRVDIWDVSGISLKHKFGWIPFEGRGHGGGNRDVKWAAFVDNDHVLTLSTFGKLVLWKLPELQAVYSTSVAFGTTPALSAGRKYLAISTGIGLVVLDAKSGEAQRSFKGAEKTGQLAFRPDGKRIAQATTKRLLVWEFSSGELYRDIGLTADINKASIAWPAPNYILVGNRFLVDLEKYSILWDYRGGEAFASIGRRLWYLCSSGNSRSLVPQSIPHGEAGKVAKGLQPRQYECIQPGATVSLQINIKAPQGTRQRIQKQFEKQLGDRGINVAPNSPVKLVVETGLGEREKIRYVKGRFLGPPIPHRHWPGGNKEGTLVEFVQQISRVAFVTNGQTAWESLYTVEAPRHIQLKEGETTVAAVKKHEKPNLKFFDKTNLPSYIALPRKDASFGAGKLTPSCIQPQDVSPRKKETKTKSVGLRI